jgi:hypothetical protein
MGKSKSKHGKAHPYFVRYGRIYRPGRDGEEKAIALCNFAAEIMEEISLDDGCEVKLQYRIKGTLDDGTVLPIATVDATDYLDPLKWIARAWGATAIVKCGKHHELREAIQQLSKPKQYRVYTHTGWREINGKLVYLYQGGAVGASGVSVQLDPPLDRAQLPEKVEEPTEAIRCSLKLLDCGPASVIIPLLCAIYLAPLASVLEPDFALYLTGPTGSLKSELAALMQQHFGLFSRKYLPASWSSTENAIEFTLFVLKDMLAVVDDFAPQANRQAQQRQAQAAERVVRSVGNRSARARLRPDLSRHADRPPRGLVGITGEQLPEGASINARLVVVEINREELNLGAITNVQGLAKRFPHAMRAYLEWLAPKMDSVKELERIKDSLRDWFRGVSGHMRQPESLALLALGFACFLECAEEHGAISSDEADRTWETACKALSAIGHREANYLREGDPADEFLRAVNTMLAQSTVHLQRTYPTTREPEESGERIGFKDSEYVYLLPEPSLKAVREFLYKAGVSWTATIRALGQLLKQKGCLILASDGRPQRQVRTFSGTQRVFQIPLEHLDPPEKDEDSESPVPDVPDVPDRPRLSGYRKGQSSQSPSHSVPDVPDSLCI